MTDPEKTDTNWKAKFEQGRNWAQSHPLTTTAILAGLVGFALGAVAF